MIKCFAYHKPSEESFPKIKELREKASEFYELIQKLAPDSMERSTALRKLRETNMWAVAAVVINDPNAEVEL